MWWGLGLGSYRLSAIHSCFCRIFLVCLKVFLICLNSFLLIFQKQIELSLTRRICIESLHKHTFWFLFKHMQHFCKWPHWLNSGFINCLLNFMSKFGCSHWFGTSGIFFYVLIQTLRYHFLFLFTYFVDKWSCNSEKTRNFKIPMISL